MNFISDKNEILTFLKSHTLATIATINNKTLKPESALIAFAELDSLELLFLTNESSRKYTNLLDNNSIAMVIGWDPNPSKWATLQYEGKAFPVNEIDEGKYKNIFLKKKGTPCTEEFFNKLGMRLFKTVPEWIGFSRWPKGEKVKVIEIKNF